MEYKLKYFQYICISYISYLSCKYEIHMDIYFFIQIGRGTVILTVVSTITIQDWCIDLSQVAHNQREKGHLRAVESIQVPKHILLTMGEKPAKYGVFSNPSIPLLSTEKDKKCQWAGGQNHWYTKGCILSPSRCVPLSITFHLNIKPK